MSTEFERAKAQMAVAINRLKLANHNNDLPAIYNALSDATTAFQALAALRERHQFRVAS